MELYSLAHTRALFFSIAPAAGRDKALRAAPSFERFTTLPAPSNKCQTNCPNVVKDVATTVYNLQAVWSNGGPLVARCLRAAAVATRACAIESRVNVSGGVTRATAAGRNGRNRRKHAAAEAGADRQDRPLVRDPHQNKREVAKRGAVLW